MQPTEKSSYWTEKLEEEQQFLSEASYIIYKEEDTGMIYARNGSTGNIDYSGTDAVTVIQNAIDALRDSGGSIYIRNGIYEINSGFTFYDDIILYGSGKSTVLKLTNDITPFSIHNYYNVAVRDLSIEVSDGHSEAILELFADGTGSVRYCSFRDIYISNPYSSHDFTVIRLKMDDNRSILENSFENIYSEYCDRLIHIVGLSDNCWANGNLFRKIWANGYKTAIVEFSPTGTATNLANRNTFIDVKAQTKSDSKDGFKNIYRNGNVFIDCLAWDWYVASSPNYTVSFADKTGYSGNIFLTSSESGWTVKRDITNKDVFVDNKLIVTSSGYPKYKNIITVSNNIDADFNKLSDALDSISDASDDNRYLIIVVGHITDDAIATGKSYVDIIGLNGVVESTCSGAGLSLSSVSNVTVKDLTIVKTGSFTVGAYPLNIIHVDDSVTLVNCKFINNGSGSVQLAGVGIGKSCSARFIGCTAKGSDGNTFVSAGWYIASTNSANPYLEGCIGFDSSGSPAFGIAQVATPILKNCIAINKYNHGIYIRHNPAPIIDGVTVYPEQYATSWNYDSSNNGRFQPFSDAPYKLVAIQVFVNNANPGVTLDIGTTIGGSEIASGIDIGSTGTKMFSFNRVNIATGGYIYVTPSSSINNGDIMIGYTVVYNNPDCYALYIDTSGYASISNSKFISNGVSSTIYIANSYGGIQNTRISNCHIEALSPTSEYAIESTTSITGENITGCTIVGSLYQITGIDNVASGSATISNGNTSVTVNHGLAGTPTTITLTGSHSEVKDAYATNIGSTSFDITVDSAVTADRTVYWYAEYKP